VSRLLVVVGATSSPAPRSGFAQSLADAFERRTWQVAVCDIARDADRGLARALAATRRVSSNPPDGRKPTVVLIASEPLQLRLVFALASAGLLPAIKLVLRVRAAAVPLDPSLADLFPLADLIVTDSAFGSRAVAHCCVEAGTPLRRGPVVVPSALGASPSHADVLRQRTAGRRHAFGVRGDQLLIGCGAGRTSDPRAFLAMQIFRVFADGLYWNCARCGGITLFATDDALRPRPVSTCVRCGAADGAAGIRWPTARLFLADREAMRAGTANGLGRWRWTLDGMRRRWGLGGRVVVEGDDPLPPAESLETAIDRLSCLDIHLLPHHLGDVEPVLLASCAMGVPAITTRFGAAAEVLEGAARLVPPCLTLDDSAGHRTAIVDVGEAVRELLHLARDAPARKRLGDAGRVAMRAHDDTVVLPQWVEHLERLAAA
jgi:hypothetical protein